MKKALQTLSVGYSFVDYTIQISNLDLVGDLVAITRVFEDEGYLLL